MNTNLTNFTNDSLDSSNSCSFITPFVRIPIRLLNEIHETVTNYLERMTNIRRVIMIKWHNKLFVYTNKKRWGISAGGYGDEWIRLANTKLCRKDKQYFWNNKKIAEKMKQIDKNALGGWRGCVLVVPRCLIESWRCHDKQDRIYGQGNYIIGLASGRNYSVLSLANSTWKSIYSFYR